MQRLANEQSSHARAALGSSRGAVCWRVFSLSPLSLLPSFSFLSLLSPPLSVLFKKNDLRKRAPGKQPLGWYMVWGVSMINPRAAGAYEASLLRSEASKLIFW